MKLRITITVQSQTVPETPVFESDLIPPDMVYSTLAIAEQTAAATVAATYAGEACIRAYLGPTLIATFHSKGRSDGQQAPSNRIEFVRIINKLSGKVLDVSNLSTYNGASIQQWDYLKGANQEWCVVFTDGDCYRIMNRLSGKALDITGMSRDNGALAQQWDYFRSHNQHWQLAPVDNGCYIIKNKLSGKALTVADYSKKNGAVIQQWDYRGHDSQKWQIKRVMSQFNRLGIAA